jgi:uncharacterized membrane protein YtjA (UPF0391 family)
MATEPKMELSRYRMPSTGVLRWAFIFLIIALAAAILGFGGFAGVVADVARVLFFVFLLLFAIGVILHLGRGKPVV